MRLVLVVLVMACGPQIVIVDACHEVDAGEPDAGRDAGVVDAGPAPYVCDPDAGVRLFTIEWFSIQDLGGVCTRPLCGSGHPRDSSQICRLATIYADAGCVVRNTGDAGATFIDCRPLCDSDAGSFPCCKTAPLGTTACTWNSPL